MTRTHSTAVPVVDRASRSAAGLLGHLRRAWIHYALAVVLVASCAFALRVTADRQLAAARLAPQRPAPAAVTADPRPLVAVIGDDAMAPDPRVPAAARWQHAVGADLGLRIVTDAANGAGYTAGFSTAASRVPAGARIVIVFGGTNDVGANALQRLRSATAVFAAVRKAAPHATLLVVGPLSHSAGPPDALLAERDSVRSAAKIVDAPFVDPIEHHWLPVARRDVLLPDHIHPTAAGEALLAQKFEKLLRQTLR